MRTNLHRKWTIPYQVTIDLVRAFCCRALCSAYGQVSEAGDFFTTSIAPIPLRGDKHLSTSVYCCTFDSDMSKDVSPKTSLLQNTKFRYSLSNNMPRRPSTMVQGFQSWQAACNCTIQICPVFLCGRRHH